MTGFLTDLLVSLALTFALSRLFLRMTQRWSDSVLRLAAVHIVSLVLCVVAATWFFEGARPADHLCGGRLCTRRIGVALD
jgi:hypothetical protein